MKFYRILGALLLFISCLIVALAFVLMSNWPLETFLTYKIEHDNPLVKVESLKITDHSIVRDGSFHIQGINAILLIDDKKTEFKIGQIKLLDLRTLLDPNQDSHYLVNGINMVREDVKFSDAEADLKYRGVEKRWTLQGDVEIGVLELAGQTFKGTTFKLASTERELSLTDVHLMLPEGTIMGDFTISLNKDFPYNLKVEISRVPAKFIALENFNLDSQMRGLINGRLNLSGDTQRITHIDGQLDAPHGMYVNAQLLGLLLSYIPQSTQKAQIEKLIKEGKNIYIDNFKLDIMNDNSELMKTTFDLKSIEYNLDVNLGVDVNVEGGLMALLKQGLNYFPKEKK